MLIQKDERAEICTLTPTIYNILQRKHCHNPSTVDCKNRIYLHNYIVFIDRSLILLLINVQHIYLMKA